MNGDTTTWTYEASTALLVSMTYADNKYVSYNFSPAGRLISRTWARQSGGQPLRTSYLYDPATAERTGSDHSDTTPDTALQPTSETMTGVVNRTLTRAYSTADPQDHVPAGRPIGLTLADANAQIDYTVDYAFDDFGRFKSIIGPGVTDPGATYDFLGDSDLVEWTYFGDPIAPTATVQRAFEPHRDLPLTRRAAAGRGPQVGTLRVRRRVKGLITLIENSWGGSLVSQHVYANDALARRTSEVRRGPGLPSYGATYAFHTDSGTNVSEVVSQIDFKSGCSTTVATTPRTFESQRHPPFSPLRSANESVSIRVHLWPAPSSSTSSAAPEIRDPPKLRTPQSAMTFRGCPFIHASPNHKSLCPQRALWRFPMPRNEIACAGHHARAPFPRSLFPTFALHFPCAPIGANLLIVRPLSTATCAPFQ